MFRRLCDHRQPLGRITKTIQLRSINDKSWTDGLYFIELRGDRMSVANVWCIVQKNNEGWVLKGLYFLEVITWLIILYCEL